MNHDLHKGNKHNIMHRAHVYILASKAILKSFTKQSPKASFGSFPVYSRPSDIQKHAVKRLNNKRLERENYATYTCIPITPQDTDLGSEERQGPKRVHTLRCNNVSPC